MSGKEWLNEWNKKKKLSRTLWAVNAQEFVRSCGRKTKFARTHAHSHVISKCADTLARPHAYPNCVRAKHFVKFSEIQQKNLIKILSVSLPINYLNFRKFYKMYWMCVRARASATFAQLMCQCACVRANFVFRTHELAHTKMHNFGCACVLLQRRKDKSSTHYTYTNCIVVISMNFPTNFDEFLIPNH